MNLVLFRTTSNRTCFLLLEDRKLFVDIFWNKTMSVMKMLANIPISYYISLVYIQLKKHCLMININHKM